MIAGLLNHIDMILLWGFIATCAMTIIMESSRYIGLSRMSLPFLMGTFFSGRRNQAEVIGFVGYILGGWVFAGLYALMFESLHCSGWELGVLFGIGHGLFLLTTILPLLYTVHPRMASPYDGPKSKRRIEPPGFFGLHYGFSTPLVTLLAQAVYGAILGATYPN